MFVDMSVQPGCRRLDNCAMQLPKRSPDLFPLVVSESKRRRWQADAANALKEQHPFFEETASRYNTGRFKRCQGRLLGVRISPSALDL